MEERVKKQKTKVSSLNINALFFCLEIAQAIVSLDSSECLASWFSFLYFNSFCTLAYGIYPIVLCAYVVLGVALRLLYTHIHFSSNRL